MTQEESSLLNSQYNQNWNRHRHLDILFWGTPLSSIAIATLLIVQITDSSISKQIQGLLFFGIAFVVFIMATQASKFKMLMDQHATFIVELERSVKLNETPFKTQDPENRRINNLIKGNLEKWQTGLSSRSLIIGFMNLFWILLIILAITTFTMG